MKHLIPLDNLRIECHFAIFYLFKYLRVNALAEVVYSRSHRAPTYFIAIFGVHILVNIYGPQKTFGLQYNCI